VFLHKPESPGAPAVKNGADHLAAVRDGRAVYLDGKRVQDVTTHPAYRNAVASAAGLYDYQAQPDRIETMTFDLGNGRRVNRCWQLPRSYEELVRRRLALVAWAEQTCGFMGRSPDHVASALAGQVMGIEVFHAYDPKRAQALQDYFDYVRCNDLFLTYVINNVQGDRSRAFGDQGEGAEDLVARIVDEDATGITLRGAKLFATSAIMANEIYISSGQPLKPGEEHLAFSCALPMNAPGLRMLSRKSYEAHAVSEFDNPLSSRFDENDALIFFDDVKVPWERVFTCRNTGMCRAQFHDTPGHVFQNYQAQIRLSVKLRFLVGLARGVAETIGTTAFPPVGVPGGDDRVDGLRHGGRRSDARPLLPARPASALRRAGAGAGTVSADRADDSRTGGRRAADAAVLGAGLRRSRHRPDYPKHPDLAGDERAGAG
jgi:4-hydroxyphenylacetate 3-monooxygenase